MRADAYGQMEQYNIECVMHMKDRRTRMLLPVLGQADTKHVVPAPYMYMALLQTAQAVARARSAHVACVKADMVEVKGLPGD
jgi:hypothetical protein